SLLRWPTVRLGAMRELPDCDGHCVRQLLPASLGGKDFPARVAPFVRGKIERLRRGQRDRKVRRLFHTVRSLLPADFVFAAGTRSGRSVRAADWMTDFLENGYRWPALWIHLLDQSADQKTFHSKQRRAPADPAGHTDHQAPASPQDAQELLPVPPSTRR